jgi:hypothetical protein
VATPLEAGSVSQFAVHEQDLRFFDTETGKRTDAQPVRA